MCLSMDRGAGGKAWPVATAVFVASASADDLGAGFGNGAGGAVDDCGALDMCMGEGVVMRV